MFNTDYKQRLHAARIKDYYDLIVKKVAGGKLFGEDIDLNDPMQVAIGAYYLAQAEEREEQAKERIVARVVRDR